MKVVWPKQLSGLLKGDLYKYKYSQDVYIMQSLDFLCINFYCLILFYRELKNKATGLDICVPQYEHISGSAFGGSVVYHVIVVTQLFYFKTPSKHKESDIVQFMVGVVCECYIIQLLNI